MKRVIRLLEVVEDSMDVDLYLLMYSDGSGIVAYLRDESTLMSFTDENDLITKLYGLRNLKTNKHELN